MPSSPTHDVAIVGGGFYGCVLGLHRRRSLGQRVVILESADDLLARASFGNQARVHSGYHYPRSLLTAYRSRVNFERFVQDYRDCVDHQFTSYYAVGRLFSKVTAGQFELFCRRIGAPLTAAPDHIAHLFDPHLVEAVFGATEAVFDAVKLRDRLDRELVAEGVEVRLGTEATRVRKREDGFLDVELAQGGETDRVTARQVFNCTYSRLNHLLVASDLTPIPLKHELTELALVEVPEPLSDVGVTVMCGPFFSLLPFPALGLHTLSHVRYTPHCEWEDSAKGEYRDSARMLLTLRRRSHYVEMWKDASRYLPLLRDCHHVDSLWEVKTVLPQSEIDDSRPILLKQHPAMPGLASILGSKIDNIYDMIDATTACLPQ